MAEFELSFNREVPLPPEALWRGWTEPELLLQWFTPAPWVTIAADVDLKPGGRFTNTMRGPDGTEVSGAGCYLVVEPNRRIVWTSAVTEGFVPAPPVEEGFHFTAELLFEPIPSGTLYTARVIHGNAEDRDQHAAMGFEAGWGAALDQLIALMS